MVVLAPSVNADVAETPGDAGFVIVGSQNSSGLGLVRTFADNDNNGKYEAQADELIPYSTPMTDGIRVASGDVDGDGNDELIVAPSATGQVKIYELTTSGAVGAKIAALDGFAGGTFVSSGDLNFDGIDEVAISADSGAAPRVKVFADENSDGSPTELTDQFSAYPNTFTGGVRTAFGNTDNIGADELITAPGSGGAQPVRVWTDADNDQAVSDSPIVEAFRPFGTNYAGGMYVASGQVSNAGGNGAELMVSRSANGRTLILTDADADGKVGDDPAFDAIGKPYTSGTARLAAGDSDHSGTFVELLTAPAVGPRPIQIYDDSNDVGSLLSDDAKADSFNAFPGNGAGQYVAFARSINAVGYAYAGFPVTIPDNGLVNVPIRVPASAGIIRDLDVTLNISHTFDSDLSVVVYHQAAGTSTTLFSNVGNNDHGFQVRLNDEAGTDIGSAPDDPSNHAVVGTFNPEGPLVLSLFDGLDASGRWLLQITDQSGGDTGTVIDASLQITY